MARSRATFARSNRTRMRARFCRNASGTWASTPRRSTCTAWDGPYTVAERRRLTQRPVGVEEDALWRASRCNQLETARRDAIFEQPLSLPEHQRKDPEAIFVD